MKRPLQASIKQQHMNTRLTRLTVSITGIIALLFLMGVAIAAQASSGPSPLQHKQQVLQQRDQFMATAQAQPNKVAKDVSAAAALRPTATPVAGVQQTHQGPFPPSFFVVRSLWQGSIGNDLVIAYAGAKPNPDSTIQQGGMLIYTLTNGPRDTRDTHLVGMFLAPGTATPLSIVSVSGNLLQLQSESGSHLTFDLQTRQYGA